MVARTPLSVILYVCSVACLCLQQNVFTVRYGLEAEDKVEH